jgi:hypothetical protein
MSTRTSAARKSAATKSATPRTAKPGETAAAQRTRTDAIASEAGRPITDGLTVAQHSEHPETKGDSTVRHAEPATGKQSGEGEGGFPQGEYDVTDPTPAGAIVPQGDAETLLEAHFGDQDIERLQELLGDARLDDEEYALVIEAAPVGFVLEHEAPDRWRAHRTGQNRWGHGRTARGAIEQFVLGGTPNIVDAAAEAFAKLPAADQRAIKERDARAARSVGAPVEDLGRDEAREDAARRVQPPKARRREASRRVGKKATK